jgi:amino acid transporter
MSQINKSTGISVFMLVMLITISIDSIRNMPATALFGSSLIFFFIFSAVTFLLPTALVSAELSAAWPKQSGIYHWVRLAFNEKTAVVAVWLQWINTMVWYPTILSFLAGTLATLINPALAQNKTYLVSIILGTFWFLTFVNLKGVKTSAKFASACAILGMVIPMAFIITLAAVWLFSGKPLQVHFTAHDILPSFKQSDSWISLTAIMTAFLGMELAAVHVNDVNNPQKTFPKALFYSTLFILVTMICGSLAIAIVLPANQINLVNGVTQAFANFLAAYHISWLLPIITTMILVGSFGGIINWVISPAKGLLQAGQDGYLPAILQKENQHGVAGNLLILQAVLVSVVCLAFLLMPSVNGSYWLLTDLSTQLYMLMYILLFLAAIVLRYKFPWQKRSFAIPGGISGIYITCILGLIGCLITLIVGFFPPSGINVGGTLHYEIVFTSGIIAMILPVFFFCQKRYQTAQVDVLINTNEEEYSI